MSAYQEPIKLDDPAIPKGSWILVTGIGGYIASHIVDQLLAAGYKVKGTVRSTAKSQWLLDLFSRYGNENLLLEEVPDLASPGAFNAAVKGQLLYV
jgi:nucleoside-diphosphate-sugar epimerase